MDEHSQRRLTKYLGTEVNKFMSKEREKEKTQDDKNGVFNVKKNAKIAIYIMCFFMLVVLPIASIKPIFKEGNIEVIFANIIFIPSGIYLLIGARDEMVYKDGIFRCCKSKISIWKW